MDETNPYSAPRAQVRDSEHDPRRRRLASPWIRLGAVTLDTLIPGFIAVVFTLIGVLVSDTDDVPMLMYAVGAVVFLVYLIFQLKLLAENGWTLGKKICGIKIIRSNGDAAAVGRIFGLRIMVPGLLGIIPVAGFAFGLVDALFIFSDRHRTLHDRFADTLVVVA